MQPPTGQSHAAPHPEERILWDVVEEHLDEAAFLYTQWERALLSPLYKMQELRDRVEERMLAHVDGLVVAAEAAAERLLIPTLAAGLPEETCAAALALLASGRPESVDAVFTALQVADAEHQAALGRALSLLTGPYAESRLRALLTSPEASLRALALDSLSFQRRDVRSELGAALQDEAPAVVRAGLIATARLAPSAHLQKVRQHLSHPEPSVREAALRAGAIARLPDVLTVARELARTEQPSELVFLLLALLGSDTERRLLMDRAASPQAQPIELFALGFTGDLEAAAHCVELAKNPRLAALAAEAVVGITGVDLEKEKLLAPSPATRDGADPLSELDSSASFAAPPASELPLPDAEALANWWMRNRSVFLAGTRYTAGRPANTVALIDALSCSPLRRCHALALSLAVDTRGALQIETLGLAHEQLAQLSSLGERELSRVSNLSLGNIEDGYR